MIVFFAVAGREKHSGSWIDCIDWARSHVLPHRSGVRIFKARAGEKYAQVVAELTATDERLIQQGRVLAQRELRRG